MTRRIMWASILAAAVWLIWRRVRGYGASAPQQPFESYQWGGQGAPAYDPSIDATLAGATASSQGYDPLAAGAQPPDLLSPTEPATPADEHVDGLAQAPDAPADLISATEPSTPAEAPEPELLGEAAVAPGPTPHIDEQTLDSQAAPELETEPIEAGAQPADRAPADGVEPQGELHNLDVYCVRCREHRTLADARIEITSKGRRAARGVCPVCGANVFTFLPNQE
jgi:hypothetical protein